MYQVSSAGDDGHCVWYGECFTEGTHKKNCAYDGEAKTLDNKGQELLNKYCSHLGNDSGSGVKTCCDTTQLETLNENVGKAANFLRRCPSCLSNLVKHICEFTCSPVQSKFVNVTEKIPVPMTSKLVRRWIELVEFHWVSKFDSINDWRFSFLFTDKTYVNGITTFVTPRYTTGTYNSCSRVSIPSLGVLALDVMCGQYDSTQCSPERWFTYMGKAEGNDYVPFDIKYNITDSPPPGYTALDVPVTPCSQGYKASGFYLYLLRLSALISFP